MKFDFTSKSHVELTKVVAALATAPGAIERLLAVIGTAGRDKAKPMTVGLWHGMCDDFCARVSTSDHLVSGGAAWADHLAVHAFLQGWVDRLTLFLPAPLGENGFIGPRGSAASAANFYHEKFSQIIKVDSYRQILEASRRPGCEVYAEPAAPGYGAMFARNKKVADIVNAVLAYTFGEGAEPADGGTLNTWKQIRSDDRVHVPLFSLVKPDSQNLVPRPRP